MGCTLPWNRNRFHLFKPVVCAIVFSFLLERSDTPNEEYYQPMKRRKRGASVIESESCTCDDDIERSYC